MAGACSESASKKSSMKKIILLLLFCTVNLNAELLGPKVNGMLLYLGFNEGSGTYTRDSSPYTSTHTVTLSGTGWSTGRNGSCMGFDGATSNVLVPHNNSALVTASASFGCWVYCTSFVNNPFVFDKKYTDNGVYMELISNGAIEVGFNSAASRINTAAGALVVNRWYHLVFTVYAPTGEIKLYRNGILIAQKSGGTTNCATSLNNFNIGNYFNVNGALTGRIDDFFIYNGVLTASQIWTGYTHGRSSNVR